MLRLQLNEWLTLAVVWHYDCSFPGSSVNTLAAVCALVYLPSVTHMRSFYSYFHPSLHCESLLRSFTRTGRVLFPQVCRSWRFKCETAPLLDTIYTSVRQNQQREKMRKWRPPAKRKSFYSIKPSSRELFQCDNSLHQQNVISSGPLCRPVLLWEEMMWLGAVRRFLSTLALKY